MQYNLTLYDMVGQISSVKPNTNKSQAGKDVNARIRALLNYRTTWSALISKTVINIRDAYQVGAVTMTSGSTAVVGTGTSWPYADRVNTTLIGGNRSSGYQEVAPASMDNITVDTLLFCNDGVYSEVVPVVEISNSTFTGLFQFSHNDGSTLTCSSLAGLQLQLGPFNPIYTLLGVSSATGSANTGIIDMAFGGGTLTNTSYQLVNAYINVDPNLRSFVQLWDPTQGIPLATNVSQAELNSLDAQRQSTGNPQCFADLGPSVSGTFQYEIWPYQTSAYSLGCLFNRQWPVLKRPTDRPPYFIDPSIIIAGATADALRRKDIRSAADTDPYFNIQLAREFEEKFVEGAKLAAAADEEKSQQALTSSVFQPSNVQGSASFWQSHVFGDGGGYGGW